MIRFKDNIFITKTNEEAIIILDGETDDFWGVEGPLANIIYAIYENKNVNFEVIITSVLKEYKVSKEEVTADIHDCFKTLVENGLAFYA